MIVGGEQDRERERERERGTERGWRGYGQGHLVGLGLGCRRALAPSFRQAPGTLSIRWVGWRRTGAFWGRGSQPLSDSAAGQLQGASGSWA